MKKLIFAMLAVLLLNIKCYAQQPVDRLFERFGAERLEQSIPYQAEETAEEIFDEGLSFERIIKFTPQQLKKLIKVKALSAFSQYKAQLLSLMTAVLLSASINVMGENINCGEIFELICALIISAVLLEPIMGCIETSCDTVKELSRFMLIYIPTYAAILVSSGGLATAAAYQTSVMAAAQFLSQLSSRIFLPMMQGYLMLSLSGAVAKNKGISAAAASLKKAVNWGLVFAATAFTGILSLQSLITGAADSAAAKTAKFVAGSFVPIIGGAFSDALSAMHGSMRIIKTSVGGFGIIAALLTFLPILVRITVLRAVIWVSKTAGEILSAERCSEILGCFADLLSALTALLLASMMVFIISTAVMINTFTNL